MIRGSSGLHLRAGVSVAGGESGAAALELIVVVFAWLLAVVVYLNVILMLGNAMLLRSALNRAALQASAQGCLSPDAELVLEETFEGMFLARDVELSARTPALASLYFERADVADASGAPLPASERTDAHCATGRDRVANSSYIWLHLAYNQRLILLPPVQLELTSLGVSNSLNLEPVDG